VASSQCGIGVWRPGDRTLILTVAPSSIPSAPRILAGLNGRELVTATLDSFGNGTITEHDVLTGAALRVLDVAGAGSIHLNDDGAVAYIAGRAEGAQHLWLAAVGQAPRDLGPLPPYSRLLGFAHDRFLLSAEGDNTSVDVRAIDGSPIARLPAVVPSAFDGDHVAYAVQPCQASSIVVAPIQALAPLLSRCQTPPPGTAVLAGGVLRTPLRCPPDPQMGCQGTLRVVLAHRHTGPGSRGTHSLPTVDYVVDPGTTATIQLRLTPGARRFVAAGRPARARVTTTPTNGFYREQTAPAASSVVRLVTRSR
jgi:hypothetical protein